GGCLKAKNVRFEIARPEPTGWARQARALSPTNARWGLRTVPPQFLLPILMALACCASRHWPRQPAHDLRRLFDGAFGRAPVGSVRACVALRPACPFAR